MRANTKLNLLVLLLSTLVMITGSADEFDIAMDAPASTVLSLQRALIAVAETDGLSVEDRYEQLSPVIAATHDLAYIATLAVRRHWDGFDSDQQSRYLAAFQTLSVMTYASRFSGVASDSFLAPTTRSESSDSAEVGSSIRAGDGEEISLDYVLHHSHDGWRIINIVADGVSDLALKRAEYRRILTEQTPEDLIEELERQTDDLRKNR